LVLALYGSFLPVPAREAYAGTEFGAAPSALEGAIGEIVSPQGTLELNAKRRTLELSVSNRGDRAVQIGSHFHFMEANRTLIFDRAKAYGMRLDIPAGANVRFEPGETKNVTLVEIAGNKNIRGGNGLAAGPLNDANKQTALAALDAGKFGNTAK